MSELEPRKRPKKDVVSKERHIPQLVVPVPLSEVRDFLRDALSGTSIADPVSSVLSGFAAFAPRLRYTAIDDTHTKIEIDLVNRFRGADVMFFQARRGEIDRFFVAVQDELARRAKWAPATSAEIRAIKEGKPWPPKGSDA